MEESNPAIHDTKTCQCRDCQILRKAMSILGSRKSARKAASSAANGRKNRKAGK